MICKKWRHNLGRTSLLNGDAFGKVEKGCMLCGHINIRNYGSKKAFPSMEWCSFCQLNKLVIEETNKIEGINKVRLRCTGCSHILRYYIK